MGNLVFFVASPPPWFILAVMVSLSNSQIRDLKAQAQRLKASLKVGKQGLSLSFFAALDHALQHREMVNVKFDEFKEQKKELSLQLSRSCLSQRSDLSVAFRQKIQIK